MDSKFTCFESKDRQIKDDQELTEEEIELSQRDLENVVMDS